MFFFLFAFSCIFCAIRTSDILVIIKIGHPPRWISIPREIDSSRIHGNRLHRDDELICINANEKGVEEFLHSSPPPPPHVSFAYRRNVSPPRSFFGARGYKFVNGNSSEISNGTRGPISHADEINERGLIWILCKLCVCASIASRFSLRGGLIKR